MFGQFGEGLFDDFHWFVIIGNDDSVENLRQSLSYFQAKLVFKSVDDSLVLVQTVKANKTHMQGFHRNENCPHKIKYLGEIGAESRSKEEQKHVDNEKDWHDKFILVNALKIGIFHVRKIIEL